MKLTYCFLLNLILFVVLLGQHFAKDASTRFNWWPDFFAVSSSLLIGGLVSFLFYFLVVFLPDRRKRNVIKSNLKKIYTKIKRDILWQVVLASQQGGRQDLVADSETIERLMTIEGFKAAFQGGREGNEGFYAFRNYIGQDVHEYREIVLALRMLAKQIDYVLHNYIIEDDETFDFFKRLELYLMRLQNIGPGYNEEKELSQFIWEIFGGFDIIEGDRGYDPVEKMIENI